MAEAHDFSVRLAGHPDEVAAFGVFATFVSRAVAMSDRHRGL
jgi:hypothetical protein